MSTPRRSLKQCPHWPKRRDEGREGKKGKEVF